MRLRFGRIFSIGRPTCRRRCRSRAPRAAEPVSPVHERPVAAEPRDDSWAEGPPPPPAPQPEIIPVPTPRRPGTRRCERRPSSVPELDAACARNADGDARARICPARRTRRRSAGGCLCRTRSRRTGRATWPTAEARHRQHEATARGPSASQAIGAQPEPDDGPGHQQQSAQVRADRRKTRFASCLAPQGQSYLDAERAFAQGFDDLKKHQIKTYAAMQQAVVAPDEGRGPRGDRSRVAVRSGLAGIDGLTQGAAVGHLCGSLAGARAAA